MPSVCVIGGGVAGLAAAVELAAVGWPVTLCEQRSFFGGRAYAFREPQTGTIIDNGQHLLMGCYRSTFAYLRKIGAMDGVRVEQRLTIPFVDAGGTRSALACPNWPSPFHLLAGLWNLHGFPKRSLLRLVKYVTLSAAKGLVSVLGPSPFVVRQAHDELRAQDDTLTVSEWLDRLGQDPNARERFWTPLVLAVCNESPSLAAAGPLIAAMREAFAQRGVPAGLAMPIRDLNALLAQPALDYLERHGATIRGATTVEALLWNNGRIDGAQLRNGTILTADYYICALPPRPLYRLLVNGGVSFPQEWEALSRWPTVPIVSVHCWFDRPVMDVPMLGLIGSRFQWVFDKSVASRWSLVASKDVDQGPGTRDQRRSSCIALVISAAREEASWPRERIVAEAKAAVRQYLPRGRDAQIYHVQVTKELEATVSMVKDTAPLRLPTKTPWPNFFLAGDWTATGLPATIESAIRSGQMASIAIITNHQIPNTK